MDTGLSPVLEAVIARHPSVTIRRHDRPELIDGLWEAIQRRDGGETFWHAGSLAELAAALDAEDPS